MSSRNEKVMELVESTLKKNPDVENRELYEEAKKIDSDIGDLTLRQFHARYPLQVKRRMAAEKKKGRKTRRKKRQRKEPAAEGVDRDAVQEVLLDFARDLSAAEGKADMVDLLTNLDRYVDRVVQAADGGR